MDANIPTEVQSDVQNLIVLLSEKNDLWDPFIELIFNFLLKPHNCDLTNDLTNFANQYKVKPLLIKNSARAMLYYFQNALRSYLPAQRVNEDLQRLGFNEEQSLSVARRWKENIVGLSRMVGNTTLDVNAVVDIDWKFGVTAASSELAQVGSTFLQLKLTLDKGNKVREEVYMELSLEQFFKFLAQMEVVKANLDMF